MHVLVYKKQKWGKETSKTKIQQQKMVHYLMYLFVKNIVWHGQMSLILISHTYMSN